MDSGHDGLPFHATVRRTLPLSVLPPPHILVFALAASGFALLPIFIARHLPLLDAPAHEARLAVLYNLVINHQGSHFYNFETFFLPNVIFDIFGLLLIGWLTPEIVGKIFFGLTLLLTISGVMILNRVATGKWSALASVAVLFVMNLTSILGFFNYIFGLALVFWALAIRLSLDSRPPFLSFLFGSCLALILLFCHVADFGIYAVMTYGFAFVALITRQEKLDRICLRLLEPIPAAAVFTAAMPAVAGGQSTYLSPFLLGKALEIPTAMTSAIVEADIAFVIGVASLLTLIVFCSRSRLVACMIPGLLGLCVIYLALPWSNGRAAYIDQRLLPAIVLLGLAGLDVRIYRGVASAFLIALIGAAVIAKQGLISLRWLSFDTQIDALAATLNRLPAGAVIIQVECEPPFNGLRVVYRERQPLMSHVPSMAAFSDTRFVATTFAIAGQQPIQVAAPFQPYYRLQELFSRSTCKAAEYGTQLARIQELSKAQHVAGHQGSPLYFLLLRPKVPGTLKAVSLPIAVGPGFELYAIRQQ